MISGSCVWILYQKIGFIHPCSDCVICCSHPLILVLKVSTPLHTMTKHMAGNRWVAAQSVFYHLYNQVSYMSLDEISPLTFSIGNTMKRISVIVSSIIIFQTPVQPINALGAAIAVFGTFLYSQVFYSVIVYPSLSLFIDPLAISFTTSRKCYFHSKHETLIALHIIGWRIHCKEIICLGCSWMNLNSLQSGYL